MNLEQIDTSNTAGKARVMQLAAEGRKTFVKFKGEDYAIDMVETSNHEWDWSKHDYVVAMEPVGPDELWAAFHKNGGIAAVYTSSPMAYQGIGVARYIRSDLAGEVKP